MVGRSAVLSMVKYHADTAPEMMRMPKPWNQWQGARHVFTSRSIRTGVPPQSILMGTSGKSMAPALGACGRWVHIGLVEVDK